MNHPSEADIQKAVEILRAGGLVAFPTETVYGLGADATNARAVAKIFAAKGRPATNPLIVHVADISEARRYVTVWPAAADQLARTFWPGPLTLVLPKADSIVPMVTAGLSTVGIRCPDHPIALELLQKFAGPVVAPSANRSNRVSPTTADHVRDELASAVDLILDGGPCRIGIESTVVDLTLPRPAILRPGAIRREQIEKIIGPIDSRAVTANPSQPAASPGQQPVHYSPLTPAFRFSQSDLARFPNLFSVRLGRTAVLLIIRGSEVASQLRERSDPQTTIEMPDSADEYARRLYAALREADDLHADAIWVQQPPDEPQWDAVRDRLNRATRPPPEAPLH